MSQQVISLASGAGADSRRVLDKLTPKNSVLAPAVNAIYLGQIHVDTAAGTGYLAIAVGSATPANDWKQITLT